VNVDLESADVVSAGISEDTPAGSFAAWDQRLLRIKQIAETATAEQPKK
jgi:hypothetical protein